MLFCGYVVECNSNLLYSTLKTIIYLTPTKKENSSNVFIISVNENLKVSSTFEPFLQKVILYLEKSSYRFLRQSSSALTEIYFQNLVFS